MEQKTLSIKEIKKRRMLMVLPVLTLPFATLLFWIFGGGDGSSTQKAEEEKRGFNADLPIPKFKEDSSLDKMSYYDQAAIDSIKRLDQIKKDPNYLQSELEPDSLENLGEEVFGYSASRKGKTALNAASYQDPATQKIYKKLERLQRVINEPSGQLDNEQDMREFEYKNSSSEDTREMKDLEQMMTRMNEPQEPDQELKQLGGMLENILDIQHPERVEEKLRQSSKNKKGKAYSVAKKVKEDNRSLLQVSRQTAENRVKQNSFYSLDEDSIRDEVQNSLEAVVHETQTIVSGAVVKLRLINDVTIKGISIAKNSFLFGTASLKGERLEVKITNIQYRNSILPVDLGLYDMDGIAGIYIPGAISRDAAKASADRSIQSVGLASLDDSWGTQAAGMGVEAAKSLLSKKVKLIKVIVKAGYKVLLYDEKQKNNN